MGKDDSIVEMFKRHWIDRKSSLVGKPNLLFHGQLTRPYISGTICLSLFHFLPPWLARRPIIIRCIMGSDLDYEG
jgi:hypothetical protein